MGANTQINNIYEFMSKVSDGRATEVRFLKHGLLSEPSDINNSLYIYDGGIYRTKTDSESEEVYQIYIGELTPQRLDDEINLGIRLSGYGGVFFTPNSPNFYELDEKFVHNKHITNGGQINYQFVDIDAPEEVKLDNEELKKWKIEVKEQVQAFELPPSMVIDTKNGFHVYWKVEDADKKLFRHIQLQLVNHFNGDKACKNEARLLRLPFFQHRKDPSNPYPISLKVWEMDRVYTQQELMEQLPELSQEAANKAVVSKERKVSKEISPRKRNDVIDAVLDRVKSVGDYGDSVTIHCCMPDHEDKNPSAWIDTNYMWFHCHGCRAHYELFELAEMLGWNDVIEAWNKYDLDVYAELQDVRSEIQSNEVTLIGSGTSEEILGTVQRVVDQLEDYGQQINNIHLKYIQEIVSALYQGDNTKPYLVPLDMGGGKSLIIKSFLQDIMSVGYEGGAIVVKERVEDVIKLSQQINEYVGADVAFPMYGFNAKECLYNEQHNQNLSSCLLSNGKHCPLKGNCRYHLQAENQQRFPIVVMTTQGFYYRSQNIDNYSFYKNNDSENVPREYLFIDEKPITTKVTTITYNNYKSYVRNIMRSLLNKRFDKKDDSVVKEFMLAAKKVLSIYEKELKGREIIKPISKKFSFSDDFKSLFTDLYNYQSNLYNVPMFIENIINYGCHLHKDIDGNKITASSYARYKSFNKLKSYIFDGTADVDLEYVHSEFNTFDFDPIKTYEDLTFYRMDSISGSKSSMKKDEKIIALCEDVKEIADDNPSEALFFPIFKDNRSTVEQQLSSYIEKDRVVLGTFGAIKGSNDFQHCSIAVLGGILHKTEDYYIGKSLTIYNEKGQIIEDTTASKYGNTRRFNDKRLELIKLNDMLVDYTQVIKRLNLRDNSRKVKSQVYLFHTDQILVDVMRIKFPLSEFEYWSPKNLLKQKVFRKKNNKTVQQVYSFLEDNPRNEITFTEMKETLGLSRSNLSNKLNNVNIQLLLRQEGYVIKKVGKSKCLVRE